VTRAAVGTRSLVGASPRKPNDDSARLKRTLLMRRCGSLVVLKRDKRPRDVITGVLFHLTADRQRRLQTGRRRERSEGGR
jgi:hypothetical protein